MALHPEETQTHRKKRFKHQSYEASLKQIHLPSTSTKTELDDDIGDNESHFHAGLFEWQQLNLSTTFLNFAKRTGPLSASLPLLLHHSQDVILMWLDAIQRTDDEGLKPLLDLLQKLLHDIRDSLLPSYTDILTALLNLALRRIAADTLAPLTASLSALFKHNLIKHPEMLPDTWKNMAAIVMKCNAEVQRLIAEVWGAVLRRLRGSTREEAILLMLTDLEKLQLFNAWAFVSAVKSVSQTLHTSTPAVLSPLIKFYLQAPSSEPTYTLIRRILTASAHHCKSDTFLPVVDFLTTLLTTELAERDDERLKRTLSVLAVVCAVRRGSRLNQSQISTILAQLQSIQITQTIESAFLDAAVACLVAAELQVWMGVGRRLVEKAWEDEIRGIRLAGALAELQWDGWKSVVLPLLLKNTSNILRRDRKAALSLLAFLHNQGRLKDVDPAWRNTVSQQLLESMQDWKPTEDSVVELTNIVSMTDMTPAFASTLVQIVQELVDIPSPLEDYAASPCNAGWVLGCCLQALSSAGTSYLANVDLENWIRRIIQKWGWCECTLAGLVKIAPFCATTIPVEDVYPALSAPLQSHVQAIRLHALRLLRSTAVSRSDLETAAIEHCLAAEEVPLDIQGVRERIHKISRIGTHLQLQSGLVFDIVVRWLTSQLKVNLRPLWTAVSQVFATISQKSPVEAWERIHCELENLDSGGATLPAWSSARTEQYENRVETEKTWRCPRFDETSRVLYKWLNEQQGLLQLVQAQTPSERLDLANYEMQLLHTLTECPSLAERNNRSLIPMFMSIAQPSDGGKPPRQKLVMWLTLLSKFTNPKAIYATTNLHQLYTSYISHPDRPLQSLALTCLLTYKPPNLMPHEEKLRAFLDDRRWREELTAFKFVDIPEDHRNDLIPVLIRLFYGMMREKKVRGRGGDKQTALLCSLAQCREDELQVFVDLMLQPFEHDSDLVQELFAFRGLRLDVTSKQQLGYLTLLGEVLKNLGPQLLSYWPRLLCVTMELLNLSQQALEHVSAEEEGDEEGDEGDDGRDGVETAALPPNKQFRNLRQLGFKRFADFSRSAAPFNFAPYIPAAFRSFISPRLAVFENENTQAPSSLMELFRVWSTRPETALFLVEYDDRVLPKIYQCLTAVNVKHPVISRVFDIVQQLLALSFVDEELGRRIVHPHVSTLLANLTILVEQSATSGGIAADLAHRQLSILSSISSFISDPLQATRLLGLLLPLLSRPAKAVSEKVKVDLLKIITSILPIVEDIGNPGSLVYRKTYQVFSVLFGMFRGRQARLGLVAAFDQLAVINPGIKDLAQLLADLNAFSAKRLEEPDFDRRLAAYSLLNDQLYNELSVEHWTPVLHNMLHFIHDPDELAVRTNASFSMRRYIDALRSQATPEFEVSFSRVLYPGLKKGLRSKTEQVRVEILGVIAYAVTKNASVILKDMLVLLMDGDEEANFFNNIHHIQIHRRIRALKRLCDHCASSALRSSTLNDIFVPLVGHFIAGAATMDHHLVNEAILTMGQIARNLAWSPYYRLVQYYLRIAKERTAVEKACVRTLVSALENFHFPMEEQIQVTEDAADDQIDDHAGQSEDDQPILPMGSNTARIADIVSSRLLPTLIQFLERRNETEDVLRIPVSIGIIKVALHLPAASREPQISKLLTVLSQIMRSKSSETRDLTRETICKIAVILGQDYLPMAMKELRAALLRGPQLHVLAYVVHALLVQVTAPQPAGTLKELDGCVEHVAHVSAEVVFGQSGKDVQAEEFRTTMKEVRGSTSKALDSFNIIAKFTSPAKISELLKPIRAIMYETESLKVMGQVDDVLRRVASGLNANPLLLPPDLLILCHTLLSQNARFLRQAPVVTAKRKVKRKDFIVQAKRNVSAESDHYAHNSFRFVAFGLDLFCTAFRRSHFNFSDPEIISRLEPLVVVIGNTLYSNDSQVIILGLKAASYIAKCPLRSIEKSLPVFIKQILDIVKQAGSTESEVVQAAFKSLAIIIRDCPSVKVKESELAFLLEVITPDLEEANRQASVFALLRAIVARKFVAPEIYDLMDKVSEIMVTNQSKQVQELCRGVLLQFLLDYPQGKGRLRNQMTFLAKNLSYVFESGRRSVMELLNAVISKFEETLIQEYADLLFVALVMVTANDDSPKCREMAAELIKSLLLRLDVQQQKEVISHLHTWSNQVGRPEICQVAGQVSGLVIDTLQQGSRQYIPTILEDLSLAMQRSAQLLAGLEVADETTDHMDQDIEWQLPYHALSVISKIVRIFPDLTTESDKLPWSAITAHLLFPHAWVRSAASRLIGTLYGALPVSLPDEDHPRDYPASRSGMVEVARKLCLQLKSPHLDEQLSLQIVKNLFHIGKCFCLFPVTAKGRQITDEDDEDEGNLAKEGNVAENPLAWLFTKLSYQARAAHTARRNRFSAPDNWYHQPASVLRWFAAMGSFLDATSLEQYLKHTLSPVYRIIEDDTIRDTHMDELKMLAQELLDLLQTRVGTTTFSTIYNNIRQGVVNVRRERKTARVMEATTHPAAAATRKIQRNASKRDSKKRKSQAYSEGKLVPHKKRKYE